MLGRIYSVAIGSQAQTAAKTLIEIASAADSVTIVERLHISQTSYDSSENLGMKFQDIATSGTGTATTPRPFMEGDAAFGGVVETNATIEPTYGTPVFLERGFNVLSGFEWTPANDDQAICISPSQLAGLTLDVSPSTSMNFSYEAYLREIGG